MAINVLDYNNVSIYNWCFKFLLQNSVLVKPWDGKRTQRLTSCQISLYLATKTFGANASE